MKRHLTIENVLIAYCMVISVYNICIGNIDNGLYFVGQAILWLLIFRLLDEKETAENMLHRHFDAMSKAMNKAIEKDNEEAKKKSRNNEQ